MIVNEFKGLIEKLYSDRDGRGHVQLENGKYLHIYTSGIQVNFNDCRKNALNNIVFDDEGLFIIPVDNGITRHDRKRFWDNDANVPEISRFLRP